MFFPVQSISKIHLLIDLTNWNFLGQFLNPNFLKLDKSRSSVLHVQSSNFALFFEPKSQKHNHGKGFYHFAFAHFAFAFDFRHVNFCRNFLINFSGTSFCHMLIQLFVSKATKFYLSQTYVATRSCGISSDALMTIPLVFTKCPM